jgi:hypothetical protein
VVIRRGRDRICFQLEGIENLPLEGRKRVTMGGRCKEGKGEIG